MWAGIGLIITSLMGGEANARCALPDGDDIENVSSFNGLSRLVSGDYLRHSPYYYRWLVKDRTRESQGESDDLSRSLLLDELSEAQLRLGNFADAASTMKSKSKLRYRDHLALGGIFMLGEEFAKAHRFLGRAFEMNPNGVFLPEGYAKHVLDHIAEQRSRGRKKVPVMTLEERGAVLGGFAVFMKGVSSRAGISWETRTWREAVHGMVDLILCGHRGSPIVWEMLGDLLREAPDGAVKGARGLAAKAYLQASYQSSESLWGRLEYRTLARKLLDRPTKAGLKKFERKFSKDLRRGTSLSKQVRKDEKRWSRAGKNLELRFRKRYLSNVKAR